MRGYLNDKGIDHIFIFYETKANFAERVVKTIKLKIIKYFTNKETYRWMEILPEILPDLTLQPVIIVQLKCLPLRLRILPVLYYGGDNMLLI